jgi:hypothetical protein
MEQRQLVVRVKKIDADHRLVTGLVYAPFELDTYGEFMTADDIQLMAHRFMRLDLSTVIDTNHDETPNGSYPVESFIARKDDPDFAEGSWVMTVYVPDDTTWEAVKRGDLNGFSFQCMVRPVDVEIEYSVTRDHVGETEEAEGHDHAVFVQLDDDGMVVGGFTSTDAGHSHVIRRASITGEASGHNHRYFL